MYKNYDFTNPNLIYDLYGFRPGEIGSSEKIKMITGEKDTQRALAKFPSVIKQQMNEAFKRRIAGMSPYEIYMQGEGLPSSLREYAGVLYKNQMQAVGGGGRGEIPSYSLEDWMSGKTPGIEAYTPEPMKTGQPISGQPRIDYPQVPIGARPFEVSPGMYRTPSAGYVPPQAMIQQLGLGNIQPRELPLNIGAYTPQGVGTYQEAQRQAEIARKVKTEEARKEQEYGIQKAEIEALGKTEAAKIGKTITPTEAYKTSLDIESKELNIADKMYTSDTRVINNQKKIDKNNTSISQLSQSILLKEVEGEPPFYSFIEKKKYNESLKKQNTLLQQLRDENIKYEEENENKRQDYYKQYSPENRALQKFSSGEKQFIKKVLTSKQDIIVIGKKKYSKSDLITRLQNDFPGINIDNLIRTL